MASGASFGADGVHLFHLFAYEMITSLGVVKLRFGSWSRAEIEPFVQRVIDG